MSRAGAGGGRRPGTRAGKRIERTFTIGRALGRPLLPHAKRLCGSTLARRLLFGLLSAHPERLNPAAAMCGFSRVDAMRRLPRPPPGRTARARPRLRSDPLLRAPGLACEGPRPSLRAVRAAAEQGPALRGATNPARLRPRADARRPDGDRRPRPRIRHAGRRFGYVRRSTASAPGRTRHPGSGKRARLPTSSVLDQSRAAERCGERSFSQWRDCGSRRPSERGRRGPRPIVVGPRSFRMPARNVPTRGLAGYET